MLVRIFTTLANAGTPSIHYWLSHLLPSTTVGRVQLIKDQAHLEMQDGTTLKLTNGVLYKKLKRGRPKFTIPLLVDICRIYDFGIEVDKFLTTFLNSLLGTTLTLLPFYTQAGKIYTTVPTKSILKIDLKGCKLVSKGKNESALQLNSSKRLQAQLINLVRRQAL